MIDRRAMPPWIPAVSLVALLGVAATVFPADRSWQEHPPETASTQDAGVYDQHGVSLAQSGDLASAIGQFRSALRLNPEFVDAWYHLGLAYDQARKTDEAMAGFEEALRLRPDYVEARYMLADCCRKRGDFEGELEILAQVVTRAPQFAEAHYNYGLALRDREKSQAAIQEFRAAVKLSPSNPRYLFALGAALGDVDAKEAVEVLGEAIKRGSDTADAHYNLGLALATNGDDGAAEREFNRALQVNGKNASAMRALGVTLMHEGKLQEAETTLGRALDLAPADAETANNLGAVELRLRDNSTAIQSLERAVELNPSLIKAHASLAQAYERSGRSADAARESERVRNLTAQLRSRGRAMIAVQSARDQLQSGRTAEALATLRKAVEESPDFPDAQLELGRVIRATGGSAEEAIAAFRRVLSLDPERADAHYEMGLTLERVARKAEALHEYQIATEMAPCNVAASRALGRAAFNAGQWSLAASTLRALVALDPADTQARRQFDAAVAQQKTTPQPAASR